MKFLKKIRTKKIINNAVKKAGDPIWFVSYETNDNQKGTIKIYAETMAKAKEKAKTQLDSFVDKPYKITYMSAI